MTSKLQPPTFNSSLWTTENIRSDDPWNQTPADNSEWLRRFKLEIGILKETGMESTPNT